MEHEVVLAEMQALLASLKSTLSEESGLESNVDAGPPTKIPEDNQSRQISCDLLPDHRALRRFVLLV
ncbi:hypothetical protein D9O50_04615 [Oxalobacteraceae bacterium CAVE-383]|nr:hypothetical protein D9O50_04615 [Oxalobacteraceae bacterium CAVE-383]